MVERKVGHHPTPLLRYSLESCTRDENGEGASVSRSRKRRNDSNRTKRIDKAEDYPRPTSFYVFCGLMLRTLTRSRTDLDRFLTSLPFVRTIALSKTGDFGGAFDMSTCASVLITVIYTHVVTLPLWCWRSDTDCPQHLPPFPFHLSSPFFPFLTSSISFPSSSLLAFLPLSFSMSLGTDAEARSVP